MPPRASAFKLSLTSFVLHHFHRCSWFTHMHCLVETLAVEYDRCYFATITTSGLSDDAKTPCESLKWHKLLTPWATFDSISKLFSQHWLGRTWFTECHPDFWYHTFEINNVITVKNYNKYFTLLASLWPGIAVYSLNIVWLPFIFKEYHGETRKSWLECIEFELYFW